MRTVLFQKVGKTPIIPISFKILAVFIALLLLSNFTSNFINIRMNQAQIIRMTNTLLVRQLKDMYSNAVNQNEIFLYSQDFTAAVEAVATAAEKDFEYPNSFAAGVQENGETLFQAGEMATTANFPDETALAEIIALKANNVEEGSLYFTAKGETYLGVYKYLSDWNCFLIRAELVKDMNADSNRVFLIVSLIIIGLTALFMVLGLFMFSHILRFIRTITESLYQIQKTMSQKQKLDGHIDLSGASNDDITYMGMTFNMLFDTIKNLLGIFQKFASQDVVLKAYRDQSVKLEGKQRELTILFSDIRGFTYMTETLGNDITALLTIHYDQAIRSIHEENGIIGSIIGDALLAVYGALDSTNNKSVEALRSAWAITAVTAHLRAKIMENRAEIEKLRPLTEAEERVFKAVLIDVGVGIDGGTVFYGNIGSDERMTNTVIGDNVNSSSRLEGLTRIYKVAVITSEFIKAEVEKETDRYHFVELDTVQVKGKTEGKKIFLPIDTAESDSQKIITKYTIFSEGLKKYYAGDWKTAKEKMSECGLESAHIFLERMALGKPPAKWNGIWTMTSK